MSLTPAQLTALKTDINANPDGTVVQALADGNHGAIATWYNGDASPDYWIYRKIVTPQEVSQAINLQNMADITASDSDRVIKLFQVRALANGGDFHGDDPFTRSAWDDVFSAATGDESQQAIAALWTRVATYAEKVFAESTGTGANAANADTTSWQGTLSSSDVTNALNS